jgi:tRNA modification GTPase
VVLVDTPGVRETGDPIEREAIRRSREAVRAADLVVLVLDQSRVSEDEQRMTKQFPTALRVVNKSDRARAWDAAGEGRCVRSVATTGDGVDELRRVIRQHFVGAATFDVSRARWWTQRQEVLLRRAISDPAALAEI